jgi:hypothetical protein
VERDLPQRLATVAAVRWSPDDEWLLASGADGKGRSGLFRVRVRDGAVRTETVVEGAGHGGIPGDWQPEGEVVTGEDVHALAVSPDGKATARAFLNKVIAGGREWAVDGVTWLAWKGDSLLASRGGVALSLSDEGVRRLAWANYDGGPFSVHPRTGAVAFGVGGTRSQVWVMEHVFAPLDSQR